MAFEDEPPPRSWIVRAQLLTVLVFVPYAAIPIGANTNLPLSSLVALSFFGEMTRNPRLVLLVGSIMLAPLPSTVVQLMLGDGAASLPALVAWILHTSPLVGFSVIATRRVITLVTPLGVGVLLTGVLTVAQLVAIRSGSIPLLSFYDLPGYASVAGQEFAIVNYIKRPFAQFPEPSFLAGSVALAAIVYLALSRASGRKLRRVDIAVIASAACSVYLSRSGSGLISLGVIAVAFFSVLPKGPMRQLMLIFGLGASGYAASRILTLRSGSGSNFSWTDRLTSMVSTAEHVWNDAVALFFGVGKGATSALFRSGEVRLSGSGGNSASDVSSILVRLVYECGLLVGAAIVVTFALVIWRGYLRLSGKLLGGSVLLVWTVVAGLTISYDSAGLVWATVGIGIGLLQLGPPRHQPAVNVRKGSCESTSDSQ